MLKRYKITNLFGFRTVDIDFTESIKILIGENGLGKTTVLNSLYYVLSQKYSKLSKIEFDEIELSFTNGMDISFSKDELLNYVNFKLNRKRRGIPLNILQSIDISELREMISKEKEANISDEKINKIISKYIRLNKIRPFAPHSIMIQSLFKIATEPDFINFESFNKIIKELDFSILYFPTYRRVEEDLNNLGKFRKKINNEIFESELFYEEIEEDIEISDDTLIHFGMEDVDNRIKRVEDEINKSTISGFSKVTGEMLSQLLKGFPNIEDKAVEELDENTVKIILHRVGDNLSDEDRKTILSLIEDKKSLKQKKELVYFIYKLIDIYEQHKHLDDAVKKFIQVCDKYLGDKHFNYDESSVSVKIFRNNSSDIVLLNKLSSGEKQIISMFSKIYLETKDNLVVLFDEPELSLSIEWQKQLLPDIMDSKKCKFLLSVTHSPFIFKNNLEKYAVGMNAYVSENIDGE